MSANTDLECAFIIAAGAITSDTYRRTLAPLDQVFEMVYRDIKSGYERAQRPPQEQDEK